MATEHPTNAGRPNESGFTEEVIDLAEGRETGAVPGALPTIDPAELAEMFAGNGVHEGMMGVRRADDL
jgi:hypothetical protein